MGFAAHCRRKVKKKSSFDHSQMFLGKKTPQINTFSFKIEMLQKDVQTLTGCCLSPVIIFCSASSMSVPTQICCPAERMSRLGAYCSLSNTRLCITDYADGAAVRRFCVIRVDDLNSLKYCSALSAAGIKDMIMCTK